MSERVFVTGAASGLGLAFARALVARGARVAMADVHEQRLAQAATELAGRGGEVLPLRCDVTRSADLEAAREAMLERWDGVDLLINNAGVATAGDIDQGPLADWEWVLDINLLGVVRGCRAFVPQMKRQGGGRIINVASAAGLLTPPGMASYNVSKAGVIALSETLHTELARHHIRVTVACPAFFATNLMESARSAVPGVERAVRRMMERSPLSADDVAEAVLEASARGELICIPHPLERRLWRLKRHAPAVYWRMVRARFDRLRAKLERSA